MMIRRTFVQSFLGFLGLGAVVTSAPASQKSDEELLDEYKKTTEKMKLLEEALDSRKVRYENPFFEKGYWNGQTEGYESGYSEGKYSYERNYSPYCGY